MKRDDSLWKAILEDVFDDFLRFFYQDADTLFDVDRGFEFLDKELEELFPQEDDTNIRYVDKLVKVFLKDGQEKWILVHVEVQGYRDLHFEERMFTYYYRIKDRYQHDITAWAIFTDNHVNYHPIEFNSEFLGTSVCYKFNTYKVIAQDEALLKLSNNPFSVIVLTVLLEIKKSVFQDKELIDLKIGLVKNLLEKGFSKEKIRQLLNFLKYYVRLKEENAEIFEHKLSHLTGKTYPVGIEQFLLHRERKQGIEEGVLKKTIEMVLSLFDDGFQVEIISKHTKINTDEVLDILRDHNRI